MERITFSLIEDPKGKNRTRDRRPKRRGSQYKKPPQTNRRRPRKK